MLKAQLGTSYFGKPCINFTSWLMYHCPASIYGTWKGWTDHRKVRRLPHQTLAADGWPPPPGHHPHWPWSSVWVRHRVDLGRCQVTVSSPATPALHLDWSQAEWYQHQSHWCHLQWIFIIIFFESLYFYQYIHAVKCNKRKTITTAIEKTFTWSKSTDF